MRILRPLALLTGLVGILLPETGFLAVEPVATSVNLSTVCFITSLYCPGGGSLGAAMYVETTLFNGARLVFSAAAILLFTQYGIRLMMESSDESTISEVKSAYTYGIAGAAIVTLATLIVQAVGQPFGTYGTDNSGVLVSPAVVGDTLHVIVFFMRVMVGTALTAVVVYQGIRLIILQGQDSEIEKQKQRFFHTLIGVAIITLATTVVSDFLPGSGGSSDLAVQMIGIANFLIVLIGGLSVLTFIVAGLFLVVSTDEGLKDKAKKTIFGTVIGLIIMLTSYTIVNFIIQLNPGGFSFLS
ncbi:pilin [Candidatus Peribacteria bacterium]|nr:MAG: pilin [Candidatus Peribacteria bacterium]